MTVGSERDFGANPSDMAAQSPGRLRRAGGAMTWLRGLFGSRSPAAAEHAQNPEAWLLESSEGAEAQEALGPEWMPQDLESWLAGVSDSMPAVFSQDEGNVLRLLYSGSRRPAALAKVLGVPEREAADKLRSLKEKVQLFLSSTG